MNAYDATWPKYPTEAYFIAIVARFSVEELKANLDGKAEGFSIDYYTMERPIEITPEHRSVFCGWSADGTHLNFGAGPEPTFDEFLERLEQHARQG